MVILKAIVSFYGFNQNNKLNKKIGIGTFWIYKGVENKKHKLQKIYKNTSKETYVYISKNQVKDNFQILLK